MKGACDVMIYMDNAATTKMHPDVVRANASRTWETDMATLPAYIHFLKI